MTCPETRAIANLETYFWRAFYFLKPTLRGISDLKPTFGDVSNLETYFNKRSPDFETYF